MRLTEYSYRASDIRSYGDLPKAERGKLAKTNNVSLVKIRGGKQRNPELL